MDDKKDIKLEDTGTYLFSEDFTLSSCAKAIRFILEKNLLPAAERPSHITIIIMSYGGSVDPCFALIDTIKGSQIPVHTIGLGVIASCGLMLFLAGERGHRTVTPRTSILSHQFSGFNGGKEHELLASLKRTHNTSKKVMYHYMESTGLSEEEVRKHLLPPEDVWLTADEAISLGVADKVVSAY
jgi:ATP-dependent Clp protease protease subunit